MTMMQETSTFIKNMASSDPKIRDRAVRAVQTFFSAKGDSFTYDDLMKLWKGFFYCFWLSDSTDSQNKLADLISSLVHKLPADNKVDFSESGAALFLRSFWDTMGREWPKLDHLRLNKYYNLMKKVLYQSFQLIAALSDDGECLSWDALIIKGNNSVLVGTVFDYQNKKYPESIRNFVIENYFELLKMSCAEPLSAELTVLVCEPVIQAVAYCENKAFFKQSSEALIQGLLPSVEDDEESEGEETGSETENDDVDESEMIEDEEELSDDYDTEISGDDGFNSEDFDNIKNDGSDKEEEYEFTEESDIENDDRSEDVSEEEDMDECDEEEEYIFDFSLLSKYVFDLGAHEDVPVRNRKFLYDLSELLVEIESGACHETCLHDDSDSCCHDDADSCCHDDEEVCCN